MQCTMDEKWSLVWFFNGYWTAFRGASAWTLPNTGWRFARAQRLPTRSSSFTFSRDGSSRPAVAQGGPLGGSELKVCPRCSVWSSRWMTAPAITWPALSMVQSYEENISPWLLIALRLVISNKDCGQSLLDDIVLNLRTRETFLYCI